MRITSLTEYSLIITIHLARRRARGDGAIAARELAEIEKLPGEFAEQILLRLRRSGLVDAVRGAHGGYLLARDARDITVHDVMSASDRQTFEMNCEHHPVDAERCAPESGCSIRPVWLGLQQRIDGFLRSVTLEDLLHEHAPAPAQLVSLQSSA